MVSMGTVWDRTTQVLSGRGGALARIAFLGIFLPTVVQSGYAAYFAGPLAAPGLKLLGGLLSLVILCFLIGSQLAMIALASDPAVTPDTATGIGARRLGPAIGIVLILGIAFGLLLVPPIVTVLMADPNIMAETAMHIPPTLSQGTALFAILYLLVLMILALFVSARLAVVNAVIVNERRGLGAFGRSFALTRGATWRIVGVLILYAIVILVATLAAQSVVGIVFRILLGASAAVTVHFLASIAAAAVTAAMTTVVAAFVAQLYVALSRRDDATAAVHPFG